MIVLRIVMTQSVIVLDHRGRGSAHGHPAGGGGGGGDEEGHQRHRSHAGPEGSGRAGMWAYAVYVTSYVGCHMDIGGIVAVVVTRRRKGPMAPVARWA